MAEPGRALSVLPKAHLHLHVDGAYPVEAVRRLAAVSGRTFEVPQRFRDVWEFFDAYGTVPNLVSTLDDLAMLCRSLVHAQAEDGVLYAEPAIEPQLYAPRLGSLTDVTRTMLDAFADAGADAGVEVGAMVTVNTDTDEAIAEPLARLAAQHAGAGVTAFGTACFVEPAGLRRYSAAAGIAKAAGLPVVSHAGQTGGPDSVREALDELGAVRIAHGFRSVEDETLLDRLASEGVVCDMCPVSNVALGVVPSLAEHPAPKMLAHGVRVTLNADDPLWFGTSATDQYLIARQDWGLDDRTLAAVARTGTQVAGMSTHTRCRFDAALDQWLAGPAESLS